MKPIEFPEQTVIIAKDQPQYMPLPAHINSNDSAFRMTCCWKLNWKERINILINGKLWHQVLTFNMPLQPQLLSVNKPELK